MGINKQNANIQHFVSFIQKIIPMDQSQIDAFASRAKGRVFKKKSSLSKKETFAIIFFSSIKGSSVILSFMKEQTSQKTLLLTVKIPFALLLRAL